MSAAVIGQLLSACAGAYSAASSALWWAASLPATCRESLAHAALTCSVATPRYFTPGFGPLALAWGWLLLGVLLGLLFRRAAAALVAMAGGYLTMQAAGSWEALLREHLARTRDPHRQAVLQYLLEGGVALSASPDGYLTAAAQSALLETFGGGAVAAVAQALTEDMRHALDTQCRNAHKKPRRGRPRHRAAAGGVAEAEGAGAADKLRPPAPSTLTRAPRKRGRPASLRQPGTLSTQLTSRKSCATLCPLCRTCRLSCGPQSELP